MGVFPPPDSLHALEIRAVDHHRDPLLPLRGGQFTEHGQLVIGPWVGRDVEVGEADQLGRDDLRRSVAGDMIPEEQAHGREFRVQQRLELRVVPPVHMDDVGRRQLAKDGCPIRLLEHGQPGGFGERESFGGGGQQGEDAMLEAPQARGLAGNGDQRTRRAAHREDLDEMEDGGHTIGLRYARKVENTPGMIGKCAWVWVGSVG